MQTPPVNPFAERHDPVAAIRRIQESQQRFGRGLFAGLLASLLVAPIWVMACGATTPGSRMHELAAFICGVLVGLPIRWLGRLVQLRKALWAGAPAALAIAFGTSLVELTGRTTIPPGLHGFWLGCFTVFPYAAAAFGAVVVARHDLAVDKSSPDAQDQIRVPAPLPFEDAHEVVFDEPANIWRGIIAVPGQLVLTRSELKYTERGATAPNPVIPLRHVLVADQGLNDTTLALTLRDGTKVRFVVVDRDKWVVHINARLAPA